jgi:hypothetical protein
MSRQAVERQLEKTRELQTRARTTAMVGFAAFAAGIVGDAEMATRDIIVRSGEITSGVGQITLSALSGVLLGVGVSGALRANSHSHTAAALEGILAQEQLNKPEPQSAETLPEVSARLSP